MTNNRRQRDQRYIFGDIWLSHRLYYIGEVSPFSAFEVSYKNALYKSTVIIIVPRSRRIWQHILNFWKHTM